MKILKSKLFVVSTTSIAIIIAGGLFISKFPYFHHTSDNFISGNDISTAQFSKSKGGDDEFKGVKLINKSHFVGEIKISAVGDPIEAVSKAPNEETGIGYSYRVVEADVLDEYKNVRGDKKLKIFFPDFLIGDISDPAQAQYNVGDRFFAYYEYDDKLQLYKVLTYGNGLFKVQKDSKTIKSTSHQESYEKHKSFLQKNK